VNVLSRTYGTRCTSLDIPGGAPVVYLDHVVSQWGRFSVYCLGKTKTYMITESNFYMITEPTFDGGYNNF